MRTYTVTYKRDTAGWWVASVAGIRGCHTQGRSIHEARVRIREALGLFVKDVERAQFKDRVQLPGDVRRLLVRLEKARARADAQQREALAATRRAVRRLSKRVGLSVRDTGEVVGLSHQRVQQILQADPR